MLCCGTANDWADPSEREMASEFIDETGIKPAIDQVCVRRVFTDIPEIRVKAVPNHTHGESAAARNTASLLIDRMGKALASNVVFFQGSAADARRGRTYSRSYHWAKDMNVKPQPFKPEKDDIIAMVDVDYYVNMPKMLMKYFNTYLLYTFQPSCVARDVGEYKFTFNAAGEVEYYVSGGGSYTHMVWDYEHDSLCITKRCCGIVTKCVTYLVERRRIDDDHQVILLTPLMKFSWLSAYVAGKMIPATELQRIDPVVNGFLRLRINKKEGLFTSTGRIGAYASATITTRFDDELASIARTSKYGITLSMVKGKVKDNKEGAELLAEFHMAQNDTRCRGVTLIDPYVHTYQWVENDIDYDAKPCMVSFMKPLYDGAFAPAACKNNEIRGINKRIKEVRTHAQLTDFIVRVVDEFVDLFYNTKAGNYKGTLVPVDYALVLEKQNRPSQRHILDNSHYEEIMKKAKQFGKGEAGMTITDQRIITTIEGALKRPLSEYMYAMDEVFKLQKWYAFGKTPAQLAERVVEMLETASWYGDADFERMDGRVSEVVRYLQEQLFLSGFRKEYRAELLELLRSCIHLETKSRFGVTGTSELELLSGDPTTSKVTTTTSAFTAYLHFRMQVDPSTGAYYTPKVAYKKLGLHGGDDGGTPDADVRKYVKAASMVGQKLTINVVKRGEPGVKFLARCYGPDVWYGDTNSCCDIKRTLTKFHTTAHMSGNVTPEMKLRDKAYALQLSDANTPVIGPFTRRVESLFGKLSSFENINKKFSLSFDHDAQYPNEPAEWMDDLFRADLPDFNRDMFMDWIDKTDVHSIFSPPEFAPRLEAKMKPGTVDVDGDLVTTEEPLPAEPTAEDNTPVTKPLALHVMKRKAEKAQRVKMFRARKARKSTK